MTAKELHRIERFKDSMTELPFTLEESAFVMLRTKADTAVFVSMLNRLYQWHLRKLNRSTVCSPDFTVQDFGGPGSHLCPLYFYHNTLTHSLYILISNPTRDINSAFQHYQYDKILIIQGNEAFAQQKRIYHDLTDFAHTDVAAADYIGQQREQLRYYICKNLVVSGDYFDFSRCEDAAVGMDKTITDGIVCYLSKSTQKKAAAHMVPYANAARKEDYKKEQQTTRQSGSIQLSLFSPVDTLGGEPSVHSLPHISTAPLSSLTANLPDGISNVQCRQALRKLQETSKKILDTLWEEMCN